jgi:phage tail-like protein
MSGYRDLSLALLGAFALCLPANGGAIGGRNAGFGPFTIKVEIEGVTQGVFQAVEGLASESQVIAGEENGEVLETPGPLIGSRIILKRPYDPVLSGLWGWRQSVLDGETRKHDGHIFVFDANGRMVAHWIFRQGWPSRWEVPRLRSGSDEPAEEIVEIVHIGLSLEPPAGG